MTTRIDRSDPFWRQLFFEGWRQLLARVPGGEQMLQGAALAQRASGLADDAVREALELGKPAMCAACSGIGCDRCGFTGREAAPLDVPPDIVVEPPICRACDGTGVAGEMGADGNVTRPLGDAQRDCPQCKGSGVYAGQLLRSVQPYQPGDRVRARSDLDGFPIGKLGTVQPGSSFDSAVPSTLNGRTFVMWDLDGNRQHWVPNRSLEAAPDHPDDDTKPPQ